MEKSRNNKFEKILHISLGTIGIILLLVVFSYIITYSTLQKNKPEDIILPNFKGLSIEEAKDKAENMGITIKVSAEKFDIEIEKGKIISQDPTYQPNFRIKEGATVDVIVSKGQEIVTVTKLVGKTKDKVMKELKELGLNAIFEEEYNDDIEKGIVIEQSIAEGEEVLAGSDITVKVSSGIEQVEVPDLTGLTEEEAKEEIIKANLIWKSTKKTNDTSKDKGVVGQSISANAIVDKGTEISIIINE